MCGGCGCRKGLDTPLAPNNYTSGLKNLLYPTIILEKGLSSIISAGDPTQPPQTPPCPAEGLKMQQQQPETGTDFCARNLPYQTASAVSSVCSAEEPFKKVMRQIFYVNPRGSTNVEPQLD